METESGGTRRSMGGEVKGKEANGVGSQQSRTISEHGLSSITTVDAHTSAASSRLNWHPRRYKWTRPFHWKTKSGFCACFITFRFHSTSCYSVFTCLMFTVVVLWLCSTQSAVIISNLTTFSYYGTYMTRRRLYCTQNSVVYDGSILSYTLECNIQADFRHNSPGK